MLVEMLLLVLAVGLVLFQVFGTQGMEMVMGGKKHIQGMVVVIYYKPLLDYYLLLQLKYQDMPFDYE